MKLMLKYLKPFAALVMVCLILLFGQAMCDLALPTMMSDMVSVGIQQGGLEAGAPEAVSIQGMTLLEVFLSEEDKDRLSESYITVKPGSSEAQRLSDKYPLLREQAVCLLREGLDEEQAGQVDAAYSRAAYGFLLYMKHAAESNDLENTAQRYEDMREENRDPGEFGDNLREFGVSEAPQEDSALASIPENALFTLPGGESSSQPPEEEGTVSPAPSAEPEAYAGQEGVGGKRGSQGQAFGEEGQASSTPEGQPAGKGRVGFDFSDGSGFAEADLEQIYSLLPLLAQAPEEGIRSAIEGAAAADPMMGEQVGVTFKRLFYKELGLDTDGMRSDYIWRTGLKMLGVALLGAAAAVLVGFFASRIAASVGRRLRRDLFAKVESFSHGEFDRFSTASLITRTTNDVQQVQMLITLGIRMVCYAPIIGIGGVIFAVDKSVSMSWIVAAAIVVLIGLIFVIMSLALPKFKVLQSLIDRLNLVSRESLSGMMVVRAFGNERHEEQRFERANRELSDTNLFVQRVMALMMPAMMFVMNVMSLVIVWVGGHAIEQATLRVGDMMAFLQYAMQIIMAFLMISAMFVMLPRASVSAARIQEVLDTQPEIQDPEHPVTLEQVRGEIEFKDVSFRYGGAENDALEHISFVARPGETTAIIGATGAGKSTVLNLIPRFYDVTAGEITLDGVDIRKLAQKELRQAIGYVPQKGLLFSGTVASNLRYGKEDADDGQLKQALETAQASDFVEQMWDGVNSPVSQGGSNVSGGQRQRLSIARALVRKARVYLFDDSFSALDFKTDAALRKALRKTTADATVIIVAQRVSTIMGAEQILVLDGGRVVGKGTHEELMASCPEYQEIAESQLQK